MLGRGVGKASFSHTGSAHSHGRDPNQWRVFWDPNPAIH